MTDQCVSVLAAKNKALFIPKEQIYHTLRKIEKTSSIFTVDNPSIITASVCQDRDHSLARMFCRIVAGQNSCFFVVVFFFYKQFFFFSGLEYAENECTRCFGEYVLAIIIEPRHDNECVPSEDSSLSA